MKPLRLTRLLKAGTFAPVVDTLTMPDFNKEGYAIPGTEHIVETRLQSMHIQITFDVYATEEETQQISDALRHGQAHTFVIEDTT